MNTSARRFAAPLLIAALLLGGGHTMPATAGSTTKTYTESAYGISFRYPAAWHAQLHAKSTGYAATIAKTYAVFVAPDSSAALRRTRHADSPMGEESWFWRGTP